MIALFYNGNESLKFRVEIQIGAYYELKKTVNIFMLKLLVNIA